MLHEWEALLAARCYAQCSLPIQGFEVSIYQYIRGWCPVLPLEMGLKFQILKEKAAQQAR